MPEGLTLDVDLDIDSSTLDTAFQNYMNTMGSQFDETLKSVQEMQKVLADSVEPIRKMREEAEAFTKTMKEAKDLSQTLRENISSTRMQGGGMAGVGGAGGLGGLGGLSSLFGMGGLGSLTAGLPLALLGGAAGFAGGSSIGQSLIAGITQPISGVGDILSRVASITPAGAIARAAGWEPEFIQRRGRETQAAISSQGVMGALQSGHSVFDIMQGMEGSQRARLMGGAVGFMRGIGQGPMGMFTQTVGTALGAEGGYSLGQQLGLGTGVSTGLGMLGGAILPGMAQQGIQEAMSRYQGYLSTRASMASVGMYGGSLQEMRSLRAARFGYSPEEQGQAFSGLFQGFGGGPLTRETQRTAMAYSRLYGVDMGAIGSAVGGLLNIGGGGQELAMDFVGQDVTREQTMGRVMADAVASGFGRRLPEFAQAVGSGVQMATQGPALISQMNMPEMISNMSRTLGAITRQRGVGLQAAGRMIEPLTRAPQQMISNLLTGGGDPYQMASLWTQNQARFGGSMYEMIFGEGGLQEAAQDPLGGAALEFQRGTLEEILSTGNRETQAVSLARMFPGITTGSIRNIVEQGSTIMQEQGNLQGVDLVELFTGVTEEQRNEGEDTRTVMREIQQSGESIMRDQLSAMRSNAQFSEQQLAVSAAYSQLASQFFDVQLSYSRINAALLSRIGIFSAARTVSRVLTTDLGANLANIGTEGMEGADVARNFLASMIRGAREADISFEEILGVGQRASEVQEQTEGVASEVRRRGRISSPVGSIQREGAEAEARLGNTSTRVTAGGNANR